MLFERSSHEFYIRFVQTCEISKWYNLSAYYVLQIRTSISKRGYQQCYQFLLCWKFQSCTPFSFERGVLQDIKNCRISSVVQRITNLNAIQRTKFSSAVTSDSFTSKILHLCSQFFASNFFPLFLSMNLTCSFPPIWKISYFIPLFKSGVKKDSANYMPISLLPKVSLVFKRLLFNFLFEKIRHHIIPSQFGFQSRKSAVLQLLDFIETVKLGKFAEQQYILYLVHAKAFDKVPLNVL